MPSSPTTTPRPSRSRSGWRVAAACVVSRGELVEIGGGVRIPEIVRRAGARLIEVGTTNRTRAADFEAPLADGARAGRPAGPSVQLRDGRLHRGARPGRGRRRWPIATARSSSTTSAPARCSTPRAFGLAHEPMPSERLAAGADLVTFSGDKLVGGPQAGLIVGRADLVARMRRDPLARAMRPDKVTLAGGRRDARALPRRAGRDRDPGLADDRDARRRARGAGRRPSRVAALGDAPVDGRRPRARRSAAGRCPARRCRRRARAWRPRSADGRLLAALRRGDAVGHRPDRGRRGRARPADGRPDARRAISPRIGELRSPAGA